MLYGKAGRTQLVIALLCAAVIAVYWNSLRVPLLLDDYSAIESNHSIRQLGRIADVLWPPANVTTGGRPLLNLTFALNYALSGTAPLGYHVTNVVIHLLATLLLFAVARRVLGGLRPAALVALLWAVHPLQTESVTYVSQRAESLMALFYLLTLYGFIRGTSTGPSRRWLGVSVLAFYLGTLTKEVIATAPVLILLFDGVFVAGSFRRALAARRHYYLILAAGWLVLGALMAASRVEGRIGGDLRQHVAPWTYGLTESKVLLEYAKLAFWPHPLVFDYGGTILARSAEAMLPAVAGLALVLAASVWLWRRSPAGGFLALAFFLLLAPTSSVVPVALQPMAENRMYLPLACVVLGGVVLAQRLLGRAAIAGLLALALGGGALAAARNRDYRSKTAIWTDTVAKQPGSARAQYNLGRLVVALPGHEAEAIAYMNRALQLKADFAEPHVVLGEIYGRTATASPAAIAQFEIALRLVPNLLEAHAGLAEEFAKDPARRAEAIAENERVLAAAPDYAVVHNNLANLLVRLPGRTGEAIAHYRAAIQLQPDFADAHANLAVAYAALPGHITEALGEYEQALRLAPHLGPLHYNFGNLLLRLGRPADAVPHYEAALQSQPNLVPAMAQLARALAAIPGREAEAARWCEQALQADPTLEPTRALLAKLRHTGP